MKQDFILEETEGFAISPPAAFQHVVADRRDRGHSKVSAERAGHFAFVMMLASLSACRAERVKPEAALSCQPAALAEISIPGGMYALGSEAFYPEEAPVRQVEVAPFSIDATEVTNKAFAQFVEETGYVTIAEQAPDLSLMTEDMPSAFSEPGSAVFAPPGPKRSSWWSYTPGANWRHPEGPGSTLDDRWSHPVVQVGLADAKAYAAWAGRRLPTEAEWEVAARGGLTQASYEWGESSPDDELPRANIWQGAFPIVNALEDGFAGTAPSGCFPPNGYGLYDMTGNVWEWTDSPFDRRNQTDPTYAVRGGSFLCSKSFCRRYRPSARQGQEVGLPTNHIGFRTVGTTLGAN